MGERASELMTMALLIQFIEGSKQQCYFSLLLRIYAEVAKLHTPKDAARGGNTAARAGFGV